MQLIIVTDIFGFTHQFKTWQQIFADSYATVSVINPYGDVVQQSDHEQTLYQNFINQLGHDNYAKLVENHIRNVNEPCIVVGFSAGASAAWRALAQIGKQGHNTRHFIGFYPSQVRNHHHIAPQCTTRIVLPKSESHFCIKQLHANLAKHKQVEVINTPWQHGFCNQLSYHYSKAAEQQVLQLISKPENITKAENYFHN